MSEHAKSARAAMKAKAKRMGDAGDPKARVDASSWTPPEMLNSGAKTGMRPISKRAFKRGGKVLHVEGEQAHQHAGRKPRNAGGKALTPNNYINRDSKEANRERSGGTAHVGGYKRGGATMHDDEATDRALIRKMVKGTALTGKKHGGEAGGEKWIQKAVKHPGALHKALHVPEGKKIPAKKLEKAAHSDNPKMAKRANLAMTLKRMHKADGGEIFDERNMPMPPARRMPLPQAGMGMRDNEDVGPVRPRRKSMKAREAEMLDALLRGRADGGEVSSKRKHREDGGGAGGGDPYEPGDLISGRAMPVPARQTSVTRPPEEPDVARFRELQRAAAKRKDGGKAGHGAGCRCHKCSGGKMGKAEGGKIGDIGGERPQHGGRMARATGGRAKGKTNVNIIISAGRPAVDGAAGQSGVPGGLGGPGAAPAVMPRQAPVMPAAAAPMPMPPMGGGMPMPPPQMPPPGPMGRKAGGRVYRSYKDMDAGAGSGLGRLEKTEIERRK